MWLVAEQNVTVSVDIKSWEKQQVKLQQNLLALVQCSAYFVLAAYCPNQISRIVLFCHIIIMLTQLFSLVPGTVHMLYVPYNTIAGIS